MNNITTLELLAIALRDEALSTARILTTNIIDGDITVLQVLIEDREEFPIYLTIDDSQILCVSHLWKEQEVIPGQREELLDMLLTLNIPMPLSSFSKVGKQYIIFGAMNTQSSVKDIVCEIEALSDNTLDAIELMAPYLK